MLLNVEKSGEQDKEQSKEWLGNTNPEFTIEDQQANTQMFNIYAIYIKMP